MTSNATSAVPIVSSYTAIAEALCKVDLEDAKAIIEILQSSNTCKLYIENNVLEGFSWIKPQKLSNTHEDPIVIDIITQITSHAQTNRTSGVFLNWYYQYIGYMDQADYWRVR